MQPRLFPRSGEHTCSPGCVISARAQESQETTIQEGKRALAPSNRPRSNPGQEHRSTRQRPTREDSSGDLSRHHLHRREFLLPGKARRACRPPLVVVTCRRIESPRGSQCPSSAQNGSRPRTSATRPYRWLSVLPTCSSWGWMQSWFD